MEVPSQARRRAPERPSPGGGERPRPAGNRELTHRLRLGHRQSRIVAAGRVLGPAPRDEQAVILAKNGLVSRGFRRAVTLVHAAAVKRRHCAHAPHGPADRSRSRWSICFRAGWSRQRRGIAVNVAEPHAGGIDARPHCRRCLRVHAEVGGGATATPARSQTGGRSGRAIVEQSTSGRTTSPRGRPATRGQVHQKRP